MPDRYNKLHPCLGSVQGLEGGTRRTPTSTSWTELEKETEEYERGSGSPRVFSVSSREVLQGGNGQRQILEGVTGSYCSGLHPATLTWVERLWALLYPI